ncbi:molybdate ABC transporter substrate-binding protein [Leeuwenhoekiella sp. NPDC079379]|uniref:molybdate ABC transporter substrate-binding protein n=1 Tax=Leeuwenhoekiella sp. NPDC079379 TaxID=3364122 RepID=UPI0037CACB4B
MLSLILYLKMHNSFKIVNRLLVVLTVLGISMLLITCKQKSETVLSIATAANMQFAIHELAADFTAKTGVKCQIVISSSGKLTAQIQEGAPYDIFVAADMNYPQAVYNAGMAVNPPKIYAYGKLVLWSYSNESLPILRMLTSASIQHIALANPKTAPYGSAAISVLKSQHLYDSISHKLVYGESIAQTNQFITSGAAEIGFTALAVVKSPALKNKGNWAVIDEKLYDPIAQGVVVLNREGANLNAAAVFYDYLFSPEAQKILSDFGYSGNE